MVIYKITNPVNGKCYVGQTISTFSQRKCEHIYRANYEMERTHKLYMALRKYGVDNFTWEVIEECSNREQLSEREIYYISFFNSFNRGYNMNVGGNSVSDETRQKLSEIFKGRKLPWAHKIKESRMANGGYIGWNPSGEDSKMSKEYVAVTPAGETIKFRGMRQFCKDHGLSHSNLLLVAQGKYAQHKGYTCAYA